MASDPKIPIPVRQFVHECLPSAAYLEALLLLAGSTVGLKAEIGWSAAEVSDELRSERNLMASVLAALHDAGLLAVAEEGNDGGGSSGSRYRYAPDSESQRATVASLAAVYSERRHSILTLIYERPASAMSAPPTPPPPPRPDPARAFSDAFRIMDWNKEREDN